MGKVVGVRNARTPDDAVSDYLLAQGYAAAEFERVAPGALSWRGAVFVAEPVDRTDGADEPIEGADVRG